MISCYGQINNARSYNELEELAINYYQNSKADSTIIVMEYAYENYPEELLRSSTILAQVYMVAGNFSKAIDIWKIGIEKGYAYGLNNRPYLGYFKDNADFERLVEIEMELLETLHLKYEIELPEGYSITKSYPVLYIFHGNSRNIEKSKTVWKSPIMSEEFITVFLQSYMPASSEDFRWVPDDNKTRKEFQGIYDQIIKEYSVDKQKIVFAGMSAGGRIAVEYMMNNYFPASGMVLNCPVIPPDINDDMIALFVERDNKIGIISGENDFALESQKNLINLINKHSGQARIIVNKELGHSFAPNFSQLLDEYLRWVIE